MDSLIEPSLPASHSQNLKPDAITISNVNLSLGSGAARVHILKDIDLASAVAKRSVSSGRPARANPPLLMVMAGLERADTGSIVVVGQ